MRLKGGDPFIFGRGGEEAEALAAAGVPFEIVPGVTSALAAAAYAGIPLTHRAHSSAVVFLTGHEDPAKPDARSAGRTTRSSAARSAFTWACATSDAIARRLQAGGLAPDTPAAVVQAATTDRHRTLLATLGTVAARAAAEQLAAPGLVIIGEVAAFADKLAWFESARLAGTSCEI